MTPRPTAGCAGARALARRALCELRARADPGKAAEVRRYFRHSVDALGISTPQVRAYVASLRRGAARGFTARDALAFGEVLLRDRHLEAKSCGVTMVERFSRRLGTGELETLRRWIVQHARNWATLDHLATRLLAPMAEGAPHALNAVAGWRRSRDPWLRRASAVSLVPLARRGVALDVAYRVARSLLGETDDLVRKGCGWLLREAGKTDPRRLEEFLRRHGPRIPRVTLRYAIERFPAPRRRELLAVTRGRDDGRRAIPAGRGAPGRADRR